MDVSDRSAPSRSHGGTDLYLRALDKLLRDTEDGSVVWSKQRQAEMTSDLVTSERTVYVAETPQGKLLIHGGSPPQWLSGMDLPTVAVPAARGEARLYLYAEDGSAGLFPPVRSSALQPIIEDLLTVVRFQVVGPQAQDFALRFLGEE